jgi:hypothetical protein
MNQAPQSVHDYIANLPSERREPFLKLRDTILHNLPDGFIEIIQYGMPSYVVPLKTYPNGYHCSPETPLPFISLASQKKFIALYHMGIYSDKKLHEWFLMEYPRFSKKKPDVGKSCIRFNNMNDIPYPLIGELAAKITPGDWISLYEKMLIR